MLKLFQNEENKKKKMMAVKNFQDESFKATTKNLVISGLALASALAWNEAITTTLKSILPNTKSDSLSLIVYAIIITVFSFYVIRFIDRITREKIPAPIPVPIPIPVSNGTPAASTTFPQSQFQTQIPNGSTTAQPRKVSD